ncbi:hypothetical protein [Streptomyces albipurpureus]|uniref:Integral membrane protein n=1 Tax=Streptomyces albipurpureus TaxID=2897419 RepID=A0ABT0UTW7_9ACTN|nr:hypothetical protein [Streptomyces sp. CWNU-1]MCM2391832.1 hypothetical protein [Streptomyces sp. CWNU-1]
MKTKIAPRPATPAAARPHRLVAGVGMLFLLCAWVLCAVLTLLDPHGPSRVEATMIEAAFGLLWPAGIAGLAALALPFDALSTRVRTLCLVVQYALMTIAPLLIAFTL